MSNKSAATPSKPRPGRPASNATTGAMSADKRQRERRSKQATNIQTKPCIEWTDSECLHVLASRQWRGTALDAQAWMQLGKLREFVGKQP